MLQHNISLVSNVFKVMNFNITCCAGGEDSNGDLYNFIFRSVSTTSPPNIYHILDHLQMKASFYGCWFQIAANKTTLCPHSLYQPSPLFYIYIIIIIIIIPNNKLLITPPAQSYCLTLFIRFKKNTIITLYNQIKTLICGI